MNFIKEVDLSARACMNTIVSSSSYITDILQLTNNATVKFKSMLWILSFIFYILIHMSADESIRLTPKSPFFNNKVNTSPGGHKTGAVKPMIDGHVIFRPTINLRRVNEMSPAELRNHEHSPNANSTDNISSSPRSFDNVKKPISID